MKKGCYDSKLTFLHRHVRDVIVDTIITAMVCVCNKAPEKTNFAFFTLKQIFHNTSNALVIVWVIVIYVMVYKKFAWNKLS